MNRNKNPLKEAIANHNALVTALAIPSEDEIANALFATNGDPNSAAKVLGCNVRVINKVIKGSEDLKEVKETARMTVVHNIQNMYHKAILTGKLPYFDIDAEGKMKEETVKNVDVGTRMFHMKGVVDANAEQLGSKIPKVKEEDDSKQNNLTVNVIGEDAIDKIIGIVNESKKRIEI